MTKKQVWKYRCDYCKKTGLSAGHMTNHERHCTNNPNRICRMHARIAGEDIAAPTMPDMFRALKLRPLENAMIELRRIAHNCPMCILAAIRQTGIQKWDGDPGGSGPPDLRFDFKKELEAAWQTINEADAA